MNITNFKCPCCGTEFELHSANEEERRNLIAELQVNCHGCRQDRHNAAIIRALVTKMEWAYANPGIVEARLEAEQAAEEIECEVRGLAGMVRNAPNGVWGASSPFSGDEKTVWRRIK